MNTLDHRSWFWLVVYDVQAEEFMTESYLIVPVFHWHVLASRLTVLNLKLKFHWSIRVLIKNWFVPLISVGFGNLRSTYLNFLASGCCFSIGHLGKTWTDELNLLYWWKSLTGALPAFTRVICRTLICQVVSVSRRGQIMWGEIESFYISHQIRLLL